MINKIQLSKDTAFKANYHPYIIYPDNQKILKVFKQKTSKYPNLDLVQAMHSFESVDLFFLYDGEKFLSSSYDFLTSLELKSTDAIVNRLVAIFDNLISKANMKN